MSQFERSLEVARQLGAEDGKGSDHDCDLSGEWADRESGPQVYQRIIDTAEAQVPDGEEWFTELLDEYERAYNEARETK